MIYDKICLNKSKRDFEITPNLRILSVRKHCVLDNWQPLSILVVHKLMTLTLNGILKVSEVW